MIQAVRGTRDIYGREMVLWSEIEQVFQRVCTRFCYTEFRTPILEKTELFKRGVGEATDIVGKEMYTFEDRGGESITLRPEMTAPIVRAAIEHNLLHHSPTTRLWYNASLFRYERPQAGRYRQFQQLGAELLGSAHPESDVEVIALAYQTLIECGVRDCVLEINTLGNTASRLAYKSTLVEYLEKHRETLSEDSQRRILTNPLRVLDSKSTQDQMVIADAPKLAEMLDQDSKEHFEAVQFLLNSAGIPFVVNNRLVRGLDYYTHTVFEFTTSSLGTQNALGGGGRYDPLFAMIGGSATPAVGFSLGADRIALLLEKERGGFPETPVPDVYIVASHDNARLPAQVIALRLRTNGFSVLVDLQRRSAKGQSKEAQNSKSKAVVTLSETDIANGTCSVRKVDKPEEHAVQQSTLENFLRA